MTPSPDHPNPADGMRADITEIRRLMKLMTGKAIPIRFVPGSEGETAGDFFALIIRRLPALLNAFDQLSTKEAEIERLRKVLEPAAFAFENNSLEGPCLTEADIRAMHNALDVQFFRRAAEALRLSRNGK